MDTGTKCAPNPVVGARPQNDEPRAAPARLRPLDFPQYQVQNDTSTVNQHAQDPIQLFACSEKNISVKHVKALNITLLGEVPLDRLVPEGYLPPQSWLQDPSTTTSSPDTSRTPSDLSNGAPIPTHRDFYARVRELLHPNDSAFDSLSHHPGAARTTTSPPPHPPKEKKASNTPAAATAPATKCPPATATTSSHPSPNSASGPSAAPSNPPPTNSTANSKCKTASYPSRACPLPSAPTARNARKREGES
ncbi:MAG: hypothetical protein Q9218_005381 [Villophora microphyllina]